MPASNNPITNSNPLAPGLGEDELQTGGLLEQATLDGSPFSNGGNISPVGNGVFGREVEEITPLEVTPLSPEDSDNIFRGQAPPPFQSPGARLNPQQFQQAAAAAFDALTGTPTDGQVLGQSADTAPIALTTAVNPSDLITPSSEFAILAEGKVVVNRGGDLDGDPSNPADDARVYAGKGFVFNRTPILPVQLDGQGNAVLDSDGKLVLADKAVSVAANYSVARAFRNPYSNLTPPQVVDTQTVDVPGAGKLARQRDAVFNRL